VTGLVLLNLGTPDAPTTPAVRRYLREFLSDPRVVDIHPVGRALLLYLLILPFRSPKSAHAYRAIWDERRGSPLLFHTKDLAEAVGKKLGPSWCVEVAMRYGNPSIGSALSRLEGCDRIVVLPLFPQSASSSTGTAAARVWELASKAWRVPSIDVVSAFHADAGFLAAWEAVARPALADARPDHVLFSFHGLPVRHIQKGDPYKDQCEATARALAERLGVGAHSVCYQSRLGRTPWIEPHTDKVLDELAAKGVKRLAVMCPAFVADCLETLEEIGIRARDQFRAHGGEELVLVPSLNSSPAWVDAVSALAERHAARKLLTA
jgi:ferrochelatase